MKRTAFFIVSFMFVSVFSVFGQESDFSFDIFNESDGPEDSAAYHDESYNDPFDILYNDPLIEQTAQNEPETNELPAYDYSTAVYEENENNFQFEQPVQEQPKQEAQSVQSVQTIQPAQTAQPAAAIQPSQQTQTVQTQHVQSTQSAQQTQTAQTQPVQTQPVQTQTVKTTQSSAGLQGIVPLTWELVNLIQSAGISLMDLNYYLSRSFTMVISEQYDNPKIEIKNGALVVNDQQKASQLVFINNQAGRLHGFPVSGSIDVFEVIFKSANKDIAMRFRKTQTNIFELYSAVIDTRPYTLHSDEAMPQLSINSNMNRGDSEVQAFPGAQTKLRSRNVEGSGSLNKNGVVEYIKTQKPPLSGSEIEKIVQIYFDESAFENINHDIAIAQMLHASNFFKNNQRVSGFNYSGLIELPNWDGTFSDMTEGVRAHIQHIKGYASKTLNRQKIVDPRYYLLVNLKYQGTVKTFDQLYERWTASSASYKQNIEKILNGLYQYSPR
ncbi:MAG: glucosaminidase domain-containing protein [Treponema sp.]|nr:glucosaminidase domain-containing protein [Treponema sp.]